MATHKRTKRAPRRGDAPQDRDYPVRASAGWGDRLKMLRNRDGLTQLELAKETGLGTATITRHEDGKSPRQSAVDAYCRVFKVTEAQLLHGKVDGQSEDATDASPPHAELWQQYYRTSFGQDTPRWVRGYLADFRFDSLGIAVPTLNLAHEVRMIVERNAGSKRHSRDGGTG